MIDYKFLPSCVYAFEPNLDGFIHVTLGWEGTSAEHAQGVVQNDYDEICRHFDLVSIRRPLEIDTQKDFIKQQMRYMASMRFIVRAKQKELVKDDT